MYRSWDEWRRWKCQVISYQVNIKWKNLHEFHDNSSRSIYQLQFKIEFWLIYVRGYGHELVEKGTAVVGKVVRKSISWKVRSSMERQELGKNFPTSPSFDQLHLSNFLFQLHAFQVLVSKKNRIFRLTKQLLFNANKLMPLGKLELLNYLAGTTKEQRQLFDASVWSIVRSWLNEYRLIID